MREKKQHPFAWWILSKEEEKDKRNREETKNPKLIKFGHVYKRKQLSKSRALLNYNLLSTPKPPQNILRFTVIALILFLHLFLGEREREKTPHNPHARQLHLPTSSSRAIISHYNIALGQLEVEDYPVCWCTGSAMIIGLASQPQQQQQEKIKERLEIPESNSSMMRFPGRLHTRRRRRCCCCCCIPTRTSFFSRASSNIIRYSFSPSFSFDSPLRTYRTPLDDL